ncbi:addiction module protein [Chlorobaculum limnaeum]|uniref:addiction module protein n=1 Tax=Chlorobaculum limnaeum TaxID=274537 RepID=UPI0009FF90CA|nr:addiction module protein [Chlorobaculum limnaeum]
MPATHDRIIEEALSLTANFRLSLIEKLLESLNQTIDPEIDRLWADEAERRVLQVEEGKAQWISGEEVFGRIREKHIH